MTKFVVIVIVCTLIALSLCIGDGNDNRDNRRFKVNNEYSQAWEKAGDVGYDAFRNYKGRQSQVTHAGSGPNAKAFRNRAPPRTAGGTILTRAGSVILGAVASGGYESAPIRRPQPQRLARKQQKQRRARLDPSVQAEINNFKNYKFQDFSGQADSVQLRHPAGYLAGYDSSGYNSNIE